jgi:AraC-like DNA-binding protein
MKVLPFKIPKPEHQALIYQEDYDLVFYDKLHQHEEIQISYIVEGEGTLIVGDTINYYKRGDVLVLGSNLPHVFKSDTTKQIKSLMLTLFFTKDAFGNDFFKLKELEELHSFFNKIENGFKVPSDEKLASLFIKLKSSSQLKRFILLLEILKSLSKAKKKPLSSFIYQKQYTDVEGKRMSAVMAYTMNNFNKRISLNDIAIVATMTKNAFCKYFKKRTNKTYFNFLNELRIENACKLLLVNDDISIAEIADKSGFNNISNFNRQFKAVKNIIPSKYRKTKAI